ncbi:MAG: site-specific integrase [Verrucomicrobia bacterium]|nr:site-specific integrase [Cytophagales bacterium]
MKKISYKTVFNPKNRLDKKGKALIYIRVIIDRAAYYMSTGISIEEKFWSKKRNELASGCPQSPEILSTLESVIQRMRSEELRCRRENEEITFEKLKSAVEPQKATKSPDFLTFCEKELVARNDVDEDTKRTQRRTLAVFKEFKKDISFQELSYDLIQRFEYFLIDRDLLPNTRNKYHRHIRTFINRATKQGLFKPEKQPYLNFNTPKSDTHKEALTLDEVRRLECFVFKPEEQDFEQVRDMFVFACYCGLRISDILRIKPSDLSETAGKITLEMIMYKVRKKSKRVILPLGELYEGKPQTILEKYLTDKSLSEFVFTSKDKVSENSIKAMANKANQLLKLVGKWAGITKHLSFHIARHSFATNTATFVDTKTLSELCGHDKLETTMNYYVHSTPERINKQLQKINWE